MTSKLTAQQAAALPYRPCVGVVLINADGKVFAGQRADMDNPAWQMPQGGVDAGEDTLAAAKRELLEETGVHEKDITLLRQTADWLRYDLPLDVIPKRWGGKYRGQKQHWFLMRLDRPDSCINIAYHDIEFSDWRWMQASDLLDHIVEFKRPLYEAVFAEFDLI